jgi:alpha-beta hydrolase superfamily lysophospholipase
MGLATEFINYTLDSPTGATLNLYAGEAEAGPKGIVQVGHGMAEHAARYERLAAEINRAGFHFIANDHRGHGHTRAPDASLGIFSAGDGGQKVLDDMLAVNRHARQKWPGLPLFYFGHSMGSILGLAYCIRDSEQIDGAALWNSGVDAGPLLRVFRLLLKAERFFKGSDTPSRIAERLTFEDWNARFKPNRTAFDWLSRDEAEVDKYVADPLCGFPCSSGLWLDVTGLIVNGADDTELAKIRNGLPMFLLGGGADPCSSQGSAMTRLAGRLRKAGIADVRDIVLPDTRHETLNEINRDEATAMLIGWLRMHT